MTFLRISAVLLAAMAGLSVVRADPLVIDWLDRNSWIEDDLINEPTYDGGNFNDGRISDPASFMLVHSRYYNPAATIPSGQAMRLVIEFDVLGLSANQIQETIFEFETKLVFGNVPLELHGFLGDGYAGRADVLIDNLLESFVVPASSSGDPHVKWQIDVSTFVREVLAQGGRYVGFGLRVENDLARNFGENYSVMVLAPHPYFPAYSMYRPKLKITVGPIAVSIDIKPGSDPNCFNVNGHGVVPVALLGSDAFDVTDVDITTLSFGGLAVRMRGNKGPLCGYEDSNGDGIQDLVCQFEDDPSAWNVGSDTATLSGTLLDGTPFEGSDSICVVP